MIDWKSIHDIAEEILYNNDANDDDNADADKNTTRRCDSNMNSEEVDERNTTRRVFDNTIILRRERQYKPWQIILLVKLCTR